VFPHLFHRDRHWTVQGVFAYHQCRCGARRTVRLDTRIYGPVDPGWLEPRDRHGLLVMDSGWKR